MAITAAQVKDLRERTGIPMMKCKEALVACDGDPEAAIDYLRKQGMATADRKAERDTASGTCGVACDKGRGVIVFVACETDFVAGNADFRDFAQRVAVAALAGDVTDLDALGAASLDGGDSVQDGLVAMVQKIGENMRLADLRHLTGEQVVGYNHGNRVATLVAGSGDPTPLRNVAMHVAAANPAPLALTRDEVDPARLDKEREILSQSEEVLAKPENIRPKIIEGKLKRFYKEFVLLEQEMLVDGDGKQTVGDYAEAKGIAVTGYLRRDIGD